jgi:hypothetical protein
LFQRQEDCKAIMKDGTNLLLIDLVLLMNVRSGSKLLDDVREASDLEGGVSEAKSFKSGTAKADQDMAR